VREIRRRHSNLKSSFVTAGCPRFPKRGDVSPAGPPPITAIRIGNPPCEEFQLPTGAKAQPVVLRRDRKQRCGYMDGRHYAPRGQNSPQCSERGECQLVFGRCLCARRDFGVGMTNDDPREEKERAAMRKGSGCRSIGARPPKGTCAKGGPRREPDVKQKGLRPVARNGESDYKPQEIGDPKQSDPGDEKQKA